MMGFSLLVLQALAERDAELQQLRVEDEDLSHYQERVRILEEALQTHQVQASQQEKRERQLREKMETSYKAKMVCVPIATVTHHTQRRGGSGSNLTSAASMAALETSLKEKEGVIEQLREEAIGKVCSQYWL